jgi:hypothetical protein
MHRRVVPGLPVMMVLGNALSDAAKKRTETKPPEGPCADVASIQAPAAARTSRVA